MHVRRMSINHGPWSTIRDVDVVRRLARQLPSMPAQACYISVLYELRSFFEHHHILATDEAQWNACLGGIVSDDPSICAQFRQLWLGPLQKDNKDILVWAQVSAFVSQVLTSSHLRKISILVKSRPAMPRVDASPCTTALVIHPTTNRPLSRALFLFCLLIGLVGLFISFSFILHY